MELSCDYRFSSEAAQEPAGDPGGTLLTFRLSKAYLRVYTTPYYESTTRLLGKKGYSACAHFFSLSIMSRAMRGVMPVCSSTSTPT